MARGHDQEQPARARTARISRRQFLKAGAVAGAAGTGLTLAQGRLIESALAGGTGGGSLADVEHLVILMQENRSFDHYFGTMSGVRGFGDGRSYRSFPGGPGTDPATVFHQTMTGTSITGAPASYSLSGGPEPTSLWPFELVSDPPTTDGQTLNDITHDWGPQHGAWHDGAMDRFGVEHLANDPTAAWQMTSTGGLPLPGPSKIPTGIATMGYYRQGDRLAFYRALADAFTICDAYHCSVLGPTDPNRLMSMSGSLGAHSGDVGGPVLHTYVQNREKLYGTMQWPTMPELLTTAGVSWKVYQDPTSNLLFNILTYFKSFTTPANATQARNATLGLAPVYPAEFAADVAAGTLPAVSWVLPPAFACEHPASPPEYGEWFVSQVLQTLLGNPEVWQRTVVLVVYDENGGFFDHVSPPTPGPTVQSPAGSLAGIPADVLAAAGPGGELDGEYVTMADPSNAAGPPPADWADVRGPVGLGFRTPALIVSPFSAGGWVCSDTFDHVSLLKLIEARFLSPGTLMGPGGLHISPWRYGLVGDLTSALPNLASPVAAVPPLPPTSVADPDTTTQAVVNALAGTEDYAQAYPPPAANSDAYLTADQDTVNRRPTPR